MDMLRNTYLNGKSKRLTPLEFLKKLRENETLPELATETNLVAAIQRDMKLLGLVGEEDSSLLVYLVYTSRYLDKPLSVIIKGPSGSGKTQVQRKPSLLIPPEDVISLTSMTPQSLYYMEAGELRHKVILGGERSHQDTSEQRDRTVAIRQMLSEGFISKQSVIDGKGHRLYQEGPISYSETTTKDSIFDEDANRCLQVDTDASHDQTEKILDSITESYKENSTVEVDQSKIKEKHHKFQRCLKPVKVIIPYGDVLRSKFPIEHIKVRRIYRYLMSLIEVITYLHQFQRSKNDKEDIYSTLDDYDIARKVILGSLHSHIGLGYDFAKQESAMKKLPEEIFTTDQATTVLGFKSRNSTLQLLQKLVEKGKVAIIKKGHGRVTSRWKKLWVEDSSIIPTTDEVREFLTPNTDH